MASYNRQSMMDNAPFWGYRIPEYIPYYDMDATIRGFHFTPEEELSVRFEGLNGIHKICSLVGDKKDAELDTITSEIPLDVLKDVLHARHTRQNYRMFIDTALAASCVRLMSTVKRSGRSSPFSFEYGFLCFRIVLISIGMCLLERVKDVDNTIADMISDPHTTSLQVFAEHVSKAVQKEVRNAPNPSYCDYLLGWVHQRGQPRQRPIISLTDASLLMDLLYDDRKYYLESLLSTYPPGISGVYFVIWRYWRLARMQGASVGRTLSQAATPMCELIWRYIVTATMDQELAIVLMHHDATDSFDIWKPVFVDEEDSRTVVQAFANRLLLCDPFLYAPLDPSAMPFLLDFSGQYMMHAAEDLFPIVLGNIIKHVWDILVDRKEQHSLEPILDGLGQTLSSLIKLLKAMQPISHDLVSELIDAVVEEDFLGLIARLVIEIKPAPHVANRKPTEVIAFLTRTEIFFKALCSAAPKSVIKSAFSVTFPDWFKYKLYFEWRSDAICESYGEHCHWNASGKLLQNILKLTEQRGRMSTLTTGRVQCGYARCPNPAQSSGAQLACQDCLKPYCSATCQHADWRQATEAVTHEDECALAESSS